MLTKESFLQQYENSSDEELYNMHLSVDDYTGEAQEALSLAIQKRGGIDSLKNRLEQKELVRKEEERIQEEVSKVYSAGLDNEYFKKMITSNILSTERTDELIDSKYYSLKVEEEDKKIKPRTILGSVMGGVIASIIGGILWGLQMIQMQRMFLLLGIGLVLFCYGIIRILTKQTKENRIVFVATVLSVIAALVIGQVLYEIFGQVNNN